MIGGTTLPLNLALLHVQCAEKGSRFLERAHESLNVHEVLFADLTPFLAVYGGPGGYRILAYPVE